MCGEKEKSSSIVLLRHAHTAMAGRFCGQIDPPLSEQGRNQLPALAESLAKYPFSFVFSSDLLRSRETADFIASGIGVKVELMAVLRELRFGEWEGLNWSEVSEKYPEYAQRWIEQYPLIPTPGGEEFGTFRLRVREALKEVADRVGGGCALVVTHGGVIRTALLEVHGLPESALAGLQCEYASSIELLRDNGNWALRDRRYLRESKRSLLNNSF
jgi:broad specificity phosphatase PhoE